MSLTVTEVLQSAAGNVTFHLKRCSNYGRDAEGILWEPTLCYTEAKKVVQC